MKRRSFLKMLLGGAAGLALGGRPGRATSWLAGDLDPPRGDLRAFILSDINSAYGSTDYVMGIKQSVRYALELWQPDIVLSPGDLIAGQNHSLPDTLFPLMWNAFEQHILAPCLCAGIPFALTLGNHDASSIRTGDGLFAFQRERDAAAQFWNGAGRDAGIAFVDRAQFPFYYSFTFGPPERAVFVVVWDASSARLTEEERAWAEAQLTSMRAESAAMKLVLGHLPLFGVAEGRNRPGEVIHGGDEVRVWLEQMRVHSYLSGHHHAYYPGKRGGLNLLHAGGVGPRRLLGTSAPPYTTVTLMDIELEAEFGAPQVRYTSFDIADWREIALQRLPESLEGLNGTVVRSDIVT